MRRDRDVGCEFEIRLSTMSDDVFHQAKNRATPIRRRQPHAPSAFEQTTALGNASFWEEAEVDLDRERAAREIENRS